MGESGVPGGRGQVTDAQLGVVAGGVSSVDSRAVSLESDLPWALSPVPRSCESGVSHGNTLSLFSPREGKKLERDEEGMDEK